MAASVHPDDVESAHQLHHLVAVTPWTYQALLAALATEVALVLVRKQPCHWIIDDTGMRKYGQR